MSATKTPESSQTPAALIRCTDGLGTPKPGYSRCNVCQQEVRIVHGYAGRWLCIECWTRARNIEATVFPNTEVSGGAKIMNATMQDKPSKTTEPGDSLDRPRYATRWWKRYRVVRDCYLGFEVQCWRIYLPLWLECKNAWGGIANTHPSLEKAREYAYEHRLGRDTWKA